MSQVMILEGLDDEAIPAQEQPGTMFTVAMLAVIGFLGYKAFFSTNDGGPWMRGQSFGYFPSLPGTLTGIGKKKTPWFLSPAGYGKTLSAKGVPVRKLKLKGSRRSDWNGIPKKAKKARRRK